MTTTHSLRHTWSIILAGGEGERLRPFIQRWLGVPIPKQYCTFVGTRSMLQHTWDRADRVTPPEQKVTVVSRHHPPQVWAQLQRQAGADDSCCSRATAIRLQGFSFRSRTCARGIQRRRW